MNIIKSEFYKLKKSKLSWICLIVCAVAACIIPVAVKQAIAMGEHEFEAAAGGAINALFFSLGMPIFTLVCALFTSIFVSSEFHNGTMKNYVSKGFDRKKLYLSKCLVCAVAVTAMFLVYVLLMLASGSIFLGFAPAGTFKGGVFVGVMFIIWLLIMAYTVVFVAMGMQLRSNGAAIATNICLVAILPTLMSALDYLFKFTSFKISQLWIGGNLSAIATMTPTTGNIISAVIVGVAWLLLAGIGGMFLFKKQDIK